MPQHLIRLVTTESRPRGAAARLNASATPRMLRKSCLVTRSPTRRIKGPIPERVSAQASGLASTGANELIALIGIGEQSTGHGKATNRTSLASRSDKNLGSPMSPLSYKGIISLGADMVVR